MPKPMVADSLGKTKNALPKRRSRAKPSGASTATVRQKAAREPRRQSRDRDQKEEETPCVTEAPRVRERERDRARRHEQRDERYDCLLQFPVFMRDRPGAARITATQLAQHFRRAKNPG